MLHLVQTCRAYDPETVALMMTAFDTVCQSVSESNGNENVKRKLALIILRHVDCGERDVLRLADAVLQEWTDSNQFDDGAQFAQLARG